MEQPEPFDQQLRIGGEGAGNAAAMSAVPWQSPEPIPCQHPARHSRAARYGDAHFSAFIASMSQPGSLTPPSGFPAYHARTKGFPGTVPMLYKDGDTATFDALPTNRPDNMANRFDPGHQRPPLQAGNNLDRDALLKGEITRKPLTPPGVLLVTPPMSDPKGAPDLGQGSYTDPVAPSGIVIPPLRVDATDSPLPYTSATSLAEFAQDHAPFPYLKPAIGFSFPSGAVYPVSAEYTVDGPAQELQRADGFPTPLPYASNSRPLGIDDPYSFDWPQLARTSGGESAAFTANHDRLPSVPAIYNADPFPPHDYPSGKEVGTLDDTTNPNSMSEAGENVPPKPFTLTAKDFTVAFGRTRTEDELTDQEVANDFARAWAEDPEAIKYDGMYYAEAEAPPDKDSRAASGWLPTAPETEPFPTMVPFAPLARSHAYEEDENELFEAYGASYAEAYAVALSLEFSEVKPVPDDNTGDVTGLASSILHTPSGEPILLGTMMLESDDDVAADKREPARVAESLDAASEPPLSVGRRIVRYTLLALGAAAVVVSGLYFAGLLL